MKKIIFTFIFLITAVLTIAQKTEFDKMLTGMYKYTIPLVKHDQMGKWMEEETIYILDAREHNEYTISHLKGAKEVGYDNFKIKSVNDIPKDSKVVVYCSVGYRSERIGEKLIREGFKDVYNLYGGIFDWVNNGNDIYNAEGKIKEVHAYNKDWGKWVKEENCKKVY